MTDFDIDVLVEADAWGDPDDLEAMAERAIEAACSTLKTSFAVPQELSAVFTDDAAIRVLNRDYRQKDKPTNVLSFPQSDNPLDDPSGLLGDIILAYETVRREADQSDRSFQDHVTHLIVHGFLHLLGYDHLNDDEAEEMERLEISILGSLDIDDPYGDHPIDEFPVN
ncbi:rRNA maturation RNase YbeY [Coralliovum pocilloporae]|uniref:rRNA maturation RNase YbeY n=1 Tax=Coralliovum pocilloporae TaxID=3066369 RepID=UPI003306AA87